MDKISSGIYIYYHKREKGFPNRKMSQPPNGTPFSEDISVPTPYGFPTNFDTLTESELANASFDLTRRACNACNAASAPGMEEHADWIRHGSARRLDMEAHADWMREGWEN